MSLIQPQPRHTHIFARAPREHYVEPLWVDARLFEVEEFGFGSTVLDPACGWGQILRAALDAGYHVEAADIHDSRKCDELQLDGVPFVLQDFLQSTRKARSIVCNPAFDQIEAFCRHAMALAEYKAALISPLPRMPAARWLQALPLQTVYLLSPRPSIPPAHYLETGQKAQGGRPEFCWLVFRRGYVGPPALKWLCRDNVGGRS